MSTLEERKAEYITHEINGRDFYNTFRSQLTIDIEMGTKSLESAIEIHSKFKIVGEYLLTGDWKSAYQNLAEVLANNNCPQSIIDNMKSEIGTYITTNYTW